MWHVRKWSLWKTSLLGIWSPRDNESIFQGVLLDDDIKLDNTFKLSLIADLVNVSPVLKRFYPNKTNRFLRPLWVGPDLFLYYTHASWRTPVIEKNRLKKNRRARFQASRIKRWLVYNMMTMIIEIALFRADIRAIDTWLIISLISSSTFAGDTVPTQLSHQTAWDDEEYKLRCHKPMGIKTHKLRTSAPSSSQTTAGGQGDRCEMLVVHEHVHSRVNSSKILSAGIECITFLLFSITYYTHLLITLIVLTSPIIQLMCIERLNRNTTLKTI